ncbi:MAG: hypothetical protein M3Z35_06625 [Nitrospirota bacterium]|nr:hypothetical protein [Nitrospirota bacterium]
MSDFQTVALTLVAPLIIGLIYARLKGRLAKAPTLSHVLLASGSLQCARHDWTLRRG